MSDKTGSNLVNQLTELVKGIVKEHETGQHSIEESVPSNDVNDTLRCLYPSTRGRQGSGAGTRGRGGAVTRGASTFVKKTKAKKRYVEADGSTIRCGKRKYSEIMKDVILINDPKVSEVPRRNSRQFYYMNGFVANAIKFNNGMDETDIRCIILTEFHPKLKRFEFLKAVDEQLISPKNINFWDYDTLKHVVGQGPLYIRSLEKISVSEDSDSDEHESDEHEYNRKNSHSEKSHPFPSLLAK